MNAAEVNVARPRWFSKAVLGFGLASLLSDAGHEAGTAALPALLMSLGALPAALGVIEGIADGVVAFAKLYGGSLANRMAWRKPIAVLGYLITGLSIGLFGVASSWVHILLARSLGWLARGLRGPARSAMLADAVPKSVLGRAVGFHRAMDTVGATLGPAIATVLLTWVPLRALFGYAMVPGVLAAVVFALLVKAPPVTRKETPPPLLKSLRLLPAAFRRFLLAVLAFGIGDFARTLLILRAAQLLTPEYGATRAAAIGMMLFVVHNLAAAACAYPAGRLADSVSPQRLLAVGYGLGVVTAVLAALASPSLPFLVVLFVVAGLVIGIEETLESVVTGLQVESAQRGSAYGALAATNGVGDMVSSSVVGLLWTWQGPALAFGFAAVASLVGTLLLLVSAKERAEAAPAA